MSDRTQQIVDWFTGAPLRIISVFLIALISHSVGKRAIDRAVGKLASADIKPGPGVVARQAERARTIGTVLTSIVSLKLPELSLSKAFRRKRMLLKSLILFLVWLFHYEWQVLFVFCVWAEVE